MNKLPPKKDSSNADSVEKNKPLSSCHPSEFRQDSASDTNKEDGQNKEKASWPPKITAYCTIAIVIITGLYTCYARQQVKQMKLAVAAATKQTKQVEDQFRLEQRAWIGVTGAECIIERGEPMILQVHFRNVGKTPALSLTNKTTYKSRDVGILPDFTHGEAEKVSRGIVIPQQDFTFVLDMSAGVPDRKGDAVIDDILTKKKRLWVYGITHFDDTFGQHHWLEYCFFYNPDTQLFTPCAEHNDIDSNTNSN